MQKDDKPECCRKYLGKKKEEISVRRCYGEKSYSYQAFARHHTPQNGGTVGHLERKLPGRARAQS